MQAGMESKDEMTNQPIRDLPSLKNLLDNVQNLEDFERLLPILRPFLKHLGVKIDDIEATFTEAKPLAAKVRELASIPDRFNKLFAARGWIIYDSLDVTVAQTAIAKAEAGDPDGAEQYLVDHYDGDTVEMHLSRMIAVQAFRPRMGLALKALMDYREGRCHACVPVVLALLDGMINDLGPRGFFAEGVNLEAWDSIAAHSSGLAQLAKVLGAKRDNRTTDPIDIPYRHGVLHGMDLGYDNRIAAVKAWTALFAAREWALKAERGELNAPPRKPKPTWMELFRQIMENADNKARLDRWTPRSVRLGIDIPSTGAPDAYGEGTPERKLAEFLTAWERRNYGHMAERLSKMLTRDKTVGAIAGSLRTKYGGTLLKEFELISIRDQAAAITVVTTRLVYDDVGDEREETIEVRMMNEDATGNPVVRGKPGGEWRIITHLA